MTQEMDMLVRVFSMCQSFCKYYFQFLQLSQVGVTKVAWPKNPRLRKTQVIYAQTLSQYLRLLETQLDDSSLTLHPSGYTMQQEGHQALFLLYHQVYSALPSLHIFKHSHFVYIILFTMQSKKGIQINHYFGWNANVF